MRIGLFGGTFNPIHFGHLRTASEVAGAFKLERILFIPAYLPPHKETHEIAPPENRLEMVHLAVEGNPAFTVSDVELKRTGVSYTVDTVKYLKNELLNQDELFLIMGVDAFLEVDTWKSYKELFQLIPVIIMQRPIMVSGGYRLKTDLLKFIKKNISDSYQFKNESCYFHIKFSKIYYYNVSLLEISGTKIRKLIQNGKSIRYLVPEPVENYIYEQELYL
jgi:nicotinate-nucleotide adenylyltransferase